MTLRGLVWGGLLMGACAFAQDDAGRAKLTGTWQLQDEKGTPAKAVWALDDQGGTIRVTKSEGEKKLAEFSCDLGKECEVKDSGQKVKVTLYFIGSKLIELETHGDGVVKRSFTTTGQGDAMDVEVTQVSSAGKTETLHFRRAAVAAK